MLILMRRLGESIKIGDNITVTVMGIEHHNRVKLGVDAPKDIPVDREEVHNRKREGQGLPPRPRGQVKK